MDEFENMLVNVRNSYRLLYLFNRRLLDLVKYIGNKFDMHYYGGWPKYSDPSPNRGRGDPKNCAWDWLNLYLYEFRFSKGEEKENIKFSIVFQCDTGKWDANVDRLSVFKYGKSEHSKSRLIFIFSNNDFWNVEKAIEDKYMKNAYPTTENEGEYTIPKNDIDIDNMYCKIFDLNEFIDKNSVDKLLGKYVSFLKKHNIHDISI